MIGSSAALFLALTVPTLGAVLIALCGRWPNLRETVTIVTALALFMVIVSLLAPVTAGERPTLTLFEMMPGLALRLTLEPLGLLFALIASFLWIVTSFYAIGYMRGHHESHQTQFYVCFAIAIASAMGIALAGNLLTLFVFYEVLTFSTYPLVSHAKTSKAQQGARIYLALLVGTSFLFLLPAVVWVWVEAKTLDFTPGGVFNAETSDPGLLNALLVLFAFGIGKAALMPLHRWLPAAMVAPTPVSALLHAVAVVKAGVFSLLKVAFYIFGLDLMTALPASTVLTWIAAATILIGSLVAMRQDNLKRRLAYSTISQLGYIVLGAMLGSQLGILGGGLHMVTHAFGKITLFFTAGAILVATHHTKVSQLDGLGRAMPFTFIAFLLGSLSIIGLPPFGGLWSKWYLVLASLEAEQIILVAVLMISSLLNVLYLLPIPIRAFFAKPPATATGAPASGLHEAPVFCVIAQSVAALGCIALFLWPEPVLALLGQLARP